jgi:hypothetical protein
MKSSSRLHASAYRGRPLLVGRVTPVRAGNHLTLRDTNFTNAHEFGYKFPNQFVTNSCNSCL